MKINNPENIWKFYPLYFIVTDIPDHYLYVCTSINLKDRVNVIIHFIRQVT